MRECSLDECVNYLIDNLKAIVDPQSYRYTMEEFAMWNVADDLASNWENCTYFVNRLFEAGKITREIKNEISEIDNLLSEASLGGSLYEQAIWSVDGLNTHSFWKQLREKARAVLSELSSLLNA